MEFQTFGKPEAPAVLLIPGGGLDWRALHTALGGLEGDYFLILPIPDGATSAAQLAEELEMCLRQDFAGRIWGAYALREGGEALLGLLARGNVRIRTAVVDGTVLSAAPAGLERTPTRLIYWLGSRDKAAKKTCKLLKAALPALRTVTLKKLKGDQLFAAIRPDLLTARLARSFGKAKTVRLSSLMPAGAQRIWTLLPRRTPPKAAKYLTQTDPVVADEANRLYITGGSGKLVRLWSHLVQLDPVSGTETVFTDQVELAAGPLSGPVSLWARLYLRRGQKRWRRELEAEKRQGWLR